MTMITKWTIYEIEIAQAYSIHIIHSHHHHPGHFTYLRIDSDILDSLRTFASGFYVV